MRASATLPPALPGLPLLGNLLAYRRDHLSVFRHGYRTLGPIFALRLGPQRAVVLIGPDHHRFFFASVDDALSVPELYRFVVPMFGEVLNAIPEPRARLAQLALLHSAFQGGRMIAHVDAMDLECRRWLDTLGDKGSFDLYPTLSRLAMNIAARALLGSELRERMAELAPLLDDLARGMDFVLPPGLPLPRFRRRDRARARLFSMIEPVVADRAAGRVYADDFLQTIVDAPAASESPDSNRTICGLALATLFTGFLTTAAQASWALVDLLEHPHELARVSAERDEVLGSPVAPLDLHSLGALTMLDRAARESQRMHPVMSHYARYNARSYQLDGYHVPQGWLTMVCPAVAHRLAAYFPEPDNYLPERFAPGSGGIPKHPYAQIGFSAGTYRCPGAGFGANEVKTIVASLLGRYRLRLLDGAPRTDFEMGVIRPASPCRVAYERR